MNIEITQSNEEIKRKNEVNWKIKYKKFLLTIKILFLTAILVLIMSLQQLLFFNIELKSSQFNQNSIYVCVTISIILLLFLTNQFAKYKKQKKEYFENVNKLPISKVNITDKLLNFKTDNIETSVKWTAVRNFYFFENCLFLSQFTIKDNFEYLIDLNPMQKDDKNQLLKFVMENVRKK